LPPADRRRLRTRAPADALRNSPHILDADAGGEAGGEAGGDTVTFTATAGIGHVLALKDADLADDSLLPDPVLTPAVASGWRYSDLDDLAAGCARSAPSGAGRPTARSTNCFR
jgi:hypothetical protein